MATLSLMYGLTLFGTILLVMSFTMSSFLRASVRPDLLIGIDRTRSRNRRRFLHRRSMNG